MMNIATSANIIKSGLLSYTDTLNHVKTDVTVFNSDNFKNILKETVYRNNKNHNIAKKLFFSGLENHCVLNNNAFLKHTNVSDMNNFNLTQLCQCTENKNNDAQIKADLLESISINNLLKKLSNKSFLISDHKSIDTHFQQLKLLLPIFNKFDINLLDKSNLTLLQYSQNLSVTPKISQFIIICLVCCNLMYHIRSPKKNDKKDLKTLNKENQKKKRSKQPKEKENNLNFAAAFEFGL